MVVCNSVCPDVHPGGHTRGCLASQNQIKVDTDVGLLNSPLNAKIFRTIIDMQTGKATAEEIKELRRLLKSIEDKRD